MSVEMRSSTFDIVAPLAPEAPQMQENREPPVTDLPDALSLRMCWVANAPPPRLQALRLRSQPPPLPGRNPDGRSLDMLILLSSIQVVLFGKGAR